MARRHDISFAFQGELGAFSHAAAQKLLGLRINPVPCTSFRDVFEAVKSGGAALAVVPIENTLHGSVHENYDHLLDYGFPVVGETSLRISHQLITMPGMRFRDIRRVFSHPVALNQCRSFFQRHKAIEPVPFYDTAGSVKMLSRENPLNSAAIASETAAEHLRRSHSKARYRGRRPKLHAFFSVIETDGPHAASEGRSENLDCVFNAECARSAFQSNGVLRTSRSQFDKSRIAASSREALGIRLLRRSCRVNTRPRRKERSG